MKHLIFLLFAVSLLTGCGGDPPVVHASPGKLYRVYSDHTPCGDLCSPPRVSPGYWLIDEGEGTPVQFFASVTIQGAQATGQEGSFVMVFPNAVLTVTFGKSSDDNTATLTQGE